MLHGGCEALSRQPCRRSQVCTAFYAVQQGCGSIDTAYAVLGS